MVINVPHLNKNNRKAKEAAIAFQNEQSTIPDNYKELKPQAGVQSLFYNHEADVIIFGGAAGGGKAQPCYALQWCFDNMPQFTVDKFYDIIEKIPKWVKALDSKILSWDGNWKSFSEICVGDRIMNPDGQMQEIIQIHERGTQDTYKITFEDKTSAECSGDHLWGFWEARSDSRRKTRSGKKCIFDTDDSTGWNMNYISRARVRDTNWLFEQVNANRRFIVPINAALNYTNLHRGNVKRAYIYGALLGDGCLCTSSITLATMDSWIMDRCLSVIDEYSMGEKKDCKAINLRFKDQWLKNWLYNSGLKGTKSSTKFIPKGYLKESLEFRWNLVQGLFDTDGTSGSIEALKNEVSYTSVSRQLAEDVAELVRSLGYMCKIRKRDTFCYTKGYEKAGQKAYTVMVEGNDRHKLFSLPRKIESAIAHEPNILVGKAIISIEKQGKVYCRCVSVSNPNSLYITDGYNVTHNSSALLLKAAKHIKTPGYGAVIFRRTSPEITNEGGLWDESRKFYRNIPGATDREYGLDWSFPAGSAISFGHAQYEKDVENKYPGAQICFLGFDEIAKFTERQFWFLFSRNRTTCGIKPQIVGTCNPDADSWVAKLIEWWIDQDTGYPIEERSGIVRYFYRINNQIYWAGTAAELEQQFPQLSAIAPPKSFTFIPSTVDDNKILLATNPEYKSNLLSLHPVEVERLLKGNWKIKYEAGTIFNRNWFDIIYGLPEKKHGATVSFWDFAATSAEMATNQSYYSAKVKITQIDDIYYITDCFWEQVSADAGDESVLAHAQQDGKSCKVRWELEGGSAGLKYESHLKRVLRGYDAKAVKPLGDKVTRALPLARSAKQGKVKLLLGGWNTQFLSAVHQFDGTRKPLINDIVDAADGAYGELAGKGNIKTGVMPGGKIENPFK
jgi:phage terminase large subunit-like protein